MNAYLPKAWTLSLDVFYSTPTIWASELFSSWKELNFALKKEFPKQGLSLTARINDLILSSKWESHTLGLDDGYKNYLMGNDRAHAVTIGLTWNFGKTMHHEKVKADTNNEPETTIGRRRRRK